MKTIKQISLVSGLMLIGQLAYGYDCSGLTSWSNTEAYVGGSKVKHQDNAYQSNWWTQGQDPSTHSNEWQEWSHLGSCGTDTTNKPPIAKANGPYSGLVGTNIAFSSAGSNDPDGNIASYHWSFGDNSTSNEASPSHTYTSTGSYSVALTVTDDKGLSTSATSTATISDDSTPGCSAPQYFAGTQYASGDLVKNVGRKYKCNIAGWCSSSSAWAYEPGVGSYWESAWNDEGPCSGDSNETPTANANGPYSATLGDSISFSSNGSSDSDGNIVGYSWNFGDGNSSTETNPTHTYGSAGDYTVTLTVTDDKNASGSASTTATIKAPDGENIPPIAKANGPYVALVNQTVSFSSQGSSDSDGSIVSYAWDFGDNQISGSANPNHSYSRSGTYSVALTVTDDKGAKHTATTTATINKDDGNPSAKKVIGYFTQWGVYSRNYHVKDIHTSGSADKLTHIMYAFGNVKNGKCVIGDAYADYDKHYNAADSVDGVSDTWDAGSLRGNFGQLRRLKQMYPKLKIVWSFGGWTWSGGFGEAAANPTAFANSCHDLVFDSRWADVFDGIDIDWEYPNECGLTCDTSGFSGYKNLMKALRTRFGNDRLVTSAIGAGEAKINAADYGGAAQYVDFYMLMTYDFFGAWAKTGPTAPHSALYNFPNIPVEGFYSENGLNTLRSKGVPSSKILLGIGFYGRGWTGVTQSEPGGSATGPASGGTEAGIADYRILKNSCPSTGRMAGTAYAYCGNNWWSYDTPETIKEKMNYVNQQGLPGAFFWELGGDTTNGELISAIHSGL